MYTQWDISLWSAPASCVAPVSCANLFLLPTLTFQWYNVKSPRPPPSSQPFSLNHVWWDHRHPSISPTRIRKPASPALQYNLHITACHFAHTPNHFNLICSCSLYRSTVKPCWNPAPVSASFLPRCPSPLTALSCPPLPVVKVSQLSKAAMGLRRSPRTMRNDHVLLLHDWIHRSSSRCGGGTEPVAGALLLLQRFHAVDVEMSVVSHT